jgi:hypothetical protein
MLDSFDIDLQCEDVFLTKERGDSMGAIKQALLRLMELYDEDTASQVLDDYLTGVEMPITIVNLIKGEDHEPSNPIDRTQPETVQTNVQGVS